MRLSVGAGSGRRRPGRRRSSGGAGDLPALQDDGVAECVRRVWAPGRRYKVKHRFQEIAEHTNHGSSR